MTKDVLRVFTTNLIKFFVALIATFLIPALLSVDEYGYYKVFNLYASYIGILHLGYCDGMFLHYGGKNLSDMNKSRLASEQFTICMLEVFFSVLIVIYGVAFKNIIAILLGCNVLPTVMITFYTYLYQATGDFKKYALVYNFNSALTLLVNSLLVFVIRPQSGLAFAGSIVGINYMVCFYALVMFNRRFRVGIGKFDIFIVKQYVSNGFFLTIGNLSYLLFDSIDRWFVKGILGITYFAYYSFASQLLSALNMFANPIGMTLYSYLSREKSRAYEYKIKVFVVSLLFFMLNGVYILRFIVRNFFSKYMEAQSAIVLLFLAQCFLLINTIIYVNLYKTYKMQNKYFCSLVIVIGVSVVLNTLYFFGFSKSISAIALATACSMAIWSLVNLYNFRYLKLKKKHMLFLILCIATYLMTSYFMNEWMGLVVYFLTYLAALRFLATEVYQMVLDKMKKVLKRYIKKDA